MQVYTRQTKLMIQTQLSLLPRYPQEIAPGVWHVPDFLSLEQQRELLSLCRDAAKPPVGMYRPKTPTGLNVRVKVVMYALNQMTIL